MQELIFHPLLIYQTRKSSACASAFCVYQIDSLSSRIKREGKVRKSLLPSKKSWQVFSKFEKTSMLLELQQKGKKKLWIGAKTFSLVLLVFENQP